MKERAFFIRRITQERSTNIKEIFECDGLHKKKNKCFFSRGAWYLHGVNKILVSGYLNVL